jgi:tetratricopeptide (TPR) repeat protein
MRNILAALLIAFSLPVLAEEWASPIDIAYSTKNPELFSNISRAREILDSWRGQREKLIEADLLLKSVIEKDANFAPAHREYGRLYIMAGYINDGNFKEEHISPAEASILKSIEIEPNYADSYVLLGHFYTNINKYNDARIALTKAEKIGTNIPWLHLNWADLNIKQKQYAEAIKRYQYILETGTSNKKAYASALNGSTKVYWHLKQYTKANEAYKKSITHEPNNAWNWGNYSSFLLFGYNDVDGAIVNGQKAINIMDYGMGRFILACALYTKWALLIELGRFTHIQKK